MMMMIECGGGHGPKLEAFVIINLDAHNLCPSMGLTID
jgi:hypothetical protein